jgi:hypothetical protein
MKFLHDINLKYIYGVNIHFFTVFCISASSGYGVRLPASDYCIDFNCLHSVR